MMRKKQLTAPILSVKELTEGKSTGLIGVIGETIDEVNMQGELVPRFFKFKIHGGPLNRHGADDGGYETFWLDGGLKGAFKLSKVKPGLMIEILHTGEKDIEMRGEKLRVNTYDLYEIDV